MFRQFAGFRPDGRCRGHVVPAREQRPDRLPSDTGHINKPSRRTSTSPGGASQRIPRSGRGSRRHRRVPGKGLQPEAAPLRSWLLATGRVRTEMQGSRCAAAFFMSFLRHREIFPSDGGASLAASTPAHRLDEFPTGYSLAGCSPAGPASASPAGHQYAVSSSCRSRIFHPTANRVLTVCLSPGGHHTPIHEAPSNAARCWQPTSQSRQLIPRRFARAARAVPATRDASR